MPFQFNKFQYLLSSLVPQISFLYIMFSSIYCCEAIVWLLLECINMLAHGRCIDCVKHHSYMIILNYNCGCGCNCIVIAKYCRKMWLMWPRYCCGHYQNHNIVVTIVVVNYNLKPYEPMYLVMHCCSHLLACSH